MREEIKDVKSKGKIVGTCTVNIYETIDELIDNVPEKDIIDLFNKAIVIAAQAKERNAHAPTKMGKNKKLVLCMNKLTAEEMATCAGDFEAMQELAWTKLDEVEAELAAAAGDTAVAETVEEETE